MNPNQRAKEMVDITKAMYQLRMDIIDLSEEIYLLGEKKSEQGEIITEINTIEADKIVNEMNDAGRPLFSNETARKTELTKRLAKNKKYGDALAKYNDVLNHQHYMELSQVKLEAQFKMLDAQLRIQLGILQTEARYEKLTINLKTPIVKEKKCLSKTN